MSYIITLLWWVVFLYLMSFFYTKCVNKCAGWQWNYPCKVQTIYEVQVCSIITWDISFSLYNMIKKCIYFSLLRDMLIIWKINFIVLLVSIQLRQYFDTSKFAHTMNCACNAHFLHNVDDCWLGWRKWLCWKKL